MDCSYNYKKIKSISEKNLIGVSYKKNTMTDKTSSTLKKLGIASFIMMSSVFASRVLGLGREMALAYAGGAGGSVDAYQISFIIPEILNHIVASGFLSVTFIPIFSHWLSKGKEDEGWKIFSIIFNSFSLILVIFIIFSMIFAPDLVKILAPGLHDPILFNKAVKMTRIIIPAQFFFFSGGLFMAVQFAKEKFLIPALAPLLYNLFTIILGLALNSFLGIEGFAWGVLTGAFIGNFLLQYFGAKKTGLKFYPIINLKHPDFKKYLLLTLPLMAGLTMVFSTELLLKYFGSFLPKGSIAAMNYGLRIMYILVGLFGQAVGMASYPFMSRLASENKMDQLNRILNKTLKFLLLVIPVSVLLMVLRQEIVLILFKRGKFDLQATKITAEVLPFILAGTFAYAAQTLVVRAYYSIQNTWLPTVFSTIVVLLSLPLFYILMKFMGIKGIALALSITAATQVSCLFKFWNIKTNNTGGSSVYKFFIKIVAITALIGTILWKTEVVLKIFINTASVSGALSICIITGIIFLILFIGAGFIFNIDEISFIISKTVRIIVS